MIPKIAEMLVGRRIIKVVSGPYQEYGNHKGDGNTPIDLYVPGGEAYLKLDNGEILRCWNSEWGGIFILNPSKPNDKSEIEFVEKA
jgi:hypothetical protein